MRRVKPVEARAFDEDAEELARLEIRCAHERWRWLDCEACRETIGVCGEKVCEDCGETI